MLFYLMHRKKTVRDLRRAASYTLSELANISGISTTALKKYEPCLFKDLPKEVRQDLTMIFESQIGFF